MTVSRLIASLVMVGGLFLLPNASAQPVASATMASLAGVYDGGEPELAVGLELRGDGRFRYALSYGALDEQAAGTWRVEGGQVLLTSDPVVPPRFLFLGRQDRPDGQLRIVLDVPKGMSRQYFDAQLRFADGSVAERQLTDEQAPFAPEPGKRVVAVSLSLGMFDLRSEPVALATGGNELRFRFEPNDLGKVAFVGTPLRIEGRDLILLRYDRTIRFRREE